MTRALVTHSVSHGDKRRLMQFVGTRGESACTFM
jgi:hypothetical protein